MSQRAAHFNGGPFHGRVFPESLVPWPLFIPRVDQSVADEQGSDMKIAEIVSKPHYALVALNDETKTYTWIDEDGNDG